MAIGTLLELGLADSIEDAEQKLKEARPDIAIHPEFENDLKNLYPEK